jgi:hypothetical protein
MNRWDEGGSNGGVVGAYMGRNLDDSIGRVCIVDMHAHAATRIDFLGFGQHHAILYRSCDWCRASLISPVQRNATTTGAASSLNNCRASRRA